MATILMLWYLCWIVQSLLGLGTAYRRTKRNGDNGISLFGWLIVYSFAAMVPGLGYYLWNKEIKRSSSTNDSPSSKPNNTARTARGGKPNAASELVCPTCGHVLPNGSVFCEFCGKKLDDAAASKRRESE